MNDKKAYHLSITYQSSTFFDIFYELNYIIHVQYLICDKQNNIFNICIYE